MSSGGPEVVVLSTHLDDAVLSLGATIGRMAAEGRRVEVWTAPGRLGLTERIWRDLGATARARRVYRNRITGFGPPDSAIRTGL